MPLLTRHFALFLCFAMPLIAATKVTHSHDEAGGRHLTLTEKESNRVEVLVRWNFDPGSAATLAGHGEKRESGLLFAATVADETQDRGPFFTAKVTDTKMIIAFRTEKPDQPDPGIQLKLVGGFHATGVSLTFKVSFNNITPSCGTSSTQTTAITIDGLKITRDDQCKRTQRRHGFCTRVLPQETYRQL